jgi:hypothetical protein
VKWIDGAYARKAAPGSSTGCRLEIASNDGSENRGPSCWEGVREAAERERKKRQWSFGTPLAPPIERGLSWTSRAGLDGVSFGDHSTAGAATRFVLQWNVFASPWLVAMNRRSGLLFARKYESSKYRSGSLQISSFTSAASKDTRGRPKCSRRARYSPKLTLRPSRLHHPPTVSGI